MIIQAQRVRVRVRVRVRMFSSGGVVQEHARTEHLCLYICVCVCVCVCVCALSCLYLFVCATVCCMRACAAGYTYPISIYIHMHFIVVADMKANKMFFRIVEH